MPPKQPAVLVTGGAGFIGTALAIALTKNGSKVTALDNLKRRGSELNLTRLKEANVEFVHGDVRFIDDLKAVGDFELLIECSAEPSVLAGYGDTKYLFDTNLTGAYNCLETAAERKAGFIFLSTSRVYPLQQLRKLKFTETKTRLELSDQQPIPGASSRGISEDLPLSGARTLYGTSKLAAELLVEEYRETHGIQAVINRCGVIAGPWQMGKVDQGVFTHWILSHYFSKSLNYIGYGGTGKQVRDLLHIDDLTDLILCQINDLSTFDGTTLNVGGGRSGSLSLLETTRLCEDLTGNKLQIDSIAETRQGDVPIYISNCSRLSQSIKWQPKRSPEQTLTDIFQWVANNEKSVKNALTN